MTLQHPYFIDQATVPSVPPAGESSHRLLHTLIRASRLAALALLLLASHVHAVPFKTYVLEQSTQTVNHGEHMSLATTPDGRVRIAHTILEDIKISYAPDGGGLYYDINGDPGRKSLQLRGEAEPYLAFDVTTTGQAEDSYVRVYSDLDASAVFVSPRHGWSPALRLDDNEKAHVVFYQENSAGTGWDVYWATDLFGVWTLEWIALGVDFQFLVGKQIGLALSPSGAPRVAYQDGDQLVYAEYGFPWTTEVVTALDRAIDITLEIDAFDVPHILYSHDGRLKHATRSGGTWVQTLIVDTGWPRVASSLALDGQGNPHVSYHVPVTGGNLSHGGDVFYAYKSGGNWVSQLIDSSHPDMIGYYNSIAIDAYDSIHIGYKYSRSSPDYLYQLRYASSMDCNNNGIHDEDDISSGLLIDCNGNGKPDACEIALGFADDCDGNGVPDECDPDCNSNGTPDACESFSDCNHNDIPDECEVDCDDNGYPDACDIAWGIRLDCNGNGILDSCEPPFLWEPEFAETHLTNVLDIREASHAWGDWDADGDLDPLLMGTVDALPYRKSRLYLHEPWGFFDIGAQLGDLTRGAANWADWDNDGDLDISIAGVAGASHYFRTYQNNDGTFQLRDDLPTHDLTPSVTWADFDNDGDLDVLYMAGIFTDTVTRLFRNDGAAFVNLGSAGLPSVGYPTVVWGDYDADGDLDVLCVGGGSGLYNVQTAIYRNDGGVFAEDEVGLQDVSDSCDWGDYDGDGDLDIVLMGATGFLSEDALIYRNDGGAYSNIEAALSVTRGEVHWGDYDNDGDLDVLYTGTREGTTQRRTGVFRNDDGTFAEVNFGLRSLSGAIVSWSDYDSDGDLDILLSGAAGVSPNYSAVSVLYDSDCGLKNIAPSSPTNLAQSIDGTSYTFSWNPGSDAETPTPGLTYNLRVGTAPGASDIMSAMSDSATGYRRIPQMGNTTHTLSWTLDIPGAPPVFWAVQAIDGGFSGSPFATYGDDLVAVQDGPSRGFALAPSRPNPFRAGTTIDFSMDVAGDVELAAYDVAGRRLRTVLSGNLPSGRHSVRWDGRNEAGRAVPDGLYFLKLRSGTRTQTRIVVRLN